MKKRKLILGELRSPYERENYERVSDWYRAYRNDERNHFTKDGLKYSKIIAACRMKIDNAEKVLVFVEGPKGLKVGDTLLDEKESEYTIEGFEMLRLTIDIPEWYGKVTGVLLQGSDTTVGEYLAKKPDFITT